MERVIATMNKTVSLMSFSGSSSKRLIGYIENRVTPEVTRLTL
jgi:hypothetical protein